MSRMNLILHVDNFARVMLSQLEKYESKGGWEGCTAKWLFREMHRNMENARLAIENGASVEYVVRKLANAGNYAMMAADNYEREHYEDGERKDIADVIHPHDCIEHAEGLDDCSPNRPAIENEDCHSQSCSCQDHGTYVDLEDGQ